VTMSLAEGFPKWAFTPTFLPSNITAMVRKYFSTPLQLPMPSARCRSNPPGLNEGMIRADPGAAIGEPC